MDTPSLNKKIQNIESEVSNYVNKVPAFTTEIIEEYIKSPKAYIAIPIIVFFLLLFTSPKFLYDDVIDHESKNYKPVFSYRKLFMFWLVFSAVLCTSLFVYNYKKSSLFNKN